MSSPMIHTGIALLLNEAHISVSAFQRVAVKLDLGIRISFI